MTVSRYGIFEAQINTLTIVLMNRRNGLALIRCDYIFLSINYDIVLTIFTFSEYDFSSSNSHNL